MSILDHMDIGSRFPFVALVRRDLLRTLRRVKPFVWLVLLVGFSGLFVVGNWPHAGYSIARAPQLSRMVVEVSGLLWIAAAWVVVPGHAAASIVLEREQKTHELLSMTLISPMGFLLGKILNTLGLFGVLLVGSLPVYASVFFLVGLDLEVVLVAGLVVSATALSCAAVGTLCSAIFHKLIPAVVSAFIGVAIIMGGPLVLLLMVCEILSMRGMSRALENALEATCPLVVIVSIRRGFTGECLLTAGLQLLVALVCFAATVWVLRRSVRIESLAGSKSRLGRIVSRLSSQKKKPFRPIGDWSNPILVREKRWEGMARPGVRWALFIVAAIVCVPLVAGLSFFCRWSLTDLIISWMLLCLTLVGLGAPLVASTGLTREVELRRLDALRMTLLSPGAVLWGKWRAAWVSFIPVLAVMGTGFLFMAFWTSNRAGQGLSGYFAGSACVLVSTWVAISASLLASSFAKRTPTALTLAYTLTAFLFVLVIPAAVLAYEIGLEIAPGLVPSNSHPLWNHLNDGLFFVMPTGAFFWNLDQPRLAPSGNIISLYLVGNLGFCLLYGWGFLLLARQRFKRIWDTRQ